MEGSYVDRYAFIGEWYDGQASLVRRFNVFFYPLDDTLEMYDLKYRKVFVRRVKVSGIAKESFYIGATLHVFGRLLKIVDYACDETKQRFQKNVENVFVLLKPMETPIVGKILTIIFKNGLHVSRLKKTIGSNEDINFVYRNAVGDPRVPFLLEHLVGNPIYITELVGQQALAKVVKIFGSKNPTKAAPGTIRAMFGQDPVRNCAYISTSLKDAKEDLAYFFPPVPVNRLRLTATLSNCTLCIVKPHAVIEGKVGEILQYIGANGFEVTALNMMFVENVNAAEFYEVYKGIVPEYMGMVEELCSGPCVAMEIVSNDPKLNTAVEFRKFVGPADPEIGRLLRPHTLRAKFGNTKIQNAIHCSDLPEDGLLEVEYFFKILDY